MEISHDQQQALEEGVTEDVNATPMHAPNNEVTTTESHVVSTLATPTDAASQEEEKKDTFEKDCFLPMPTPGPERFTNWLAQGDDTWEVDASGDRDDDNNNNNAIVDSFMGVDQKLRGQVSRLRRHHQTVLEGNNTTCNTNKYASRSYKSHESPVWHHFTLKTRAKPSRLRRFLACGKGAYISAVRDARLMMRVMIAAIGILMSVVGFGILRSSEKLLEWKLDQSTELLEENNNKYSSFGFFIGMNILFGFLAALPVLFRPLSAGSGIAEAKAVLNGIILPGCTDLSTAACKGFSVIFAQAASLPIGMEGPLIFIGLALGDNADKYLPIQSHRFAPASEVCKVERYRKDLQAIGTACGVTSAFGTPIGAVLFALEEACSYWSLDLTWHTFTAACVTATFSYMWNIIANRAIGDFMADYVTSKFQGLPMENGMSSASSIWISFRLLDYFIFAGMGIAGGAVGAVWCELNRALAIQRTKWKLGRVAKCIEVLSLVAIASCIFWWLPQIYKVCSPFETENKSNIAAKPEYYHQALCPDGQYNELATLFWNPVGGTGINLLFWEPSTAFSASSCLIAGSVFLVLLLLFFGSSIGMGIFIPLLYVGGCYGRAFALAIDGAPVN
ncbi:Chloride transport protein 6 (Partial), partial [Seminavis robusta]|eukprot:Sro410_g137290.1 Chloride transport protein 6 (617) ;mRNA; r:63-1914